MPTTSTSEQLPSSPQGASKWKYRRWHESGDNVWHGCTRSTRPASSHTTDAKPQAPPPPPPRPLYRFQLHLQLILQKYLSFVRVSPLWLFGAQSLQHVLMPLNHALTVSPISTPKLSRLLLLLLLYKNVLHCHFWVLFGTPARRLLLEAFPGPRTEKIADP